MIRRPPRSTLSSSSAASDVYKRQQDKKYTDEFYKRFVDEIKILFKLSHPNIVRVYNYYLYPEAKTGYLQMEYVKGEPIDEFKVNWLTKDWNDIFTEAVSAFEYLEKNNILHKDIRPSNILIDEDGSIKVIDFGFGKVIDKNNQSENSILLNWPVSEMPEEVLDGEEYNHKTEVYFVGKLFHKILKNEPDFKHMHIIDKMTKVEQILR